MNDYIINLVSKIAKTPQLKKTICIIGFFLFALFFGGLYFLNFQIDNWESITNLKAMAGRMYLLYIAGSIIITMIIGFTVVIIVKNKKMGIHRKFFFTALIIGTVYMLISPFATGSDESVHFYRIYEISQGNLVTPIGSNKEAGSEMPKSLLELFAKGAVNTNYSDSLKNMKIELAEDETVVYNNYYPSTSIYSPIQYIPQVIGVYLGRIVNANPYIIGMMGRATGFMFWLVVCTLSIRILPSKKLFAVIMLLTPVSICFSTTLSGDVMTTSMVILLISYVYNILYNKRCLKKVDYAILLIISIVIALCKIVYLPVILILLLIPKESVKNYKIHRIITSVILIVATIFSLLWLRQTGKYFDLSYDKSVLQKAYILSNPIHYIFIIVRTYLSNFMTYGLDMVAGNNMYHSQVKIYSFISVYYLVLVVIAIINSEEKAIINISNKVIVGIVITAILVLIPTALYVQTTAQYIGLYYPMATGLQGRYLIPIVLLLIFMVGGKKGIYKVDSIIILSILAQLPVLLAIFVTFMI